jgi:hypothetical protein
MDGLFIERGLCAWKYLWRKDREMENETLLNNANRPATQAGFRWRGKKICDAVPGEERRDEGVRE